MTTFPNGQPGRRPYLKSLSRLNISQHPFFEGLYEDTVVPVIVQFQVLRDLGTRHTGSLAVRDWGAIGPPEPVPNGAAGR